MLNIRFCSLFPLISSLLSSSFLQVIPVSHLIQVGYNIAPKLDTPLSEMLALGLERYVDELTEISLQASKEYALEKVCLAFIHVCYCSVISVLRIETMRNLIISYCTLFFGGTVVRCRAHNPRVVCSISALATFEDSVLGQGVNTNCASLHPGE